MNSKSTWIWLIVAAGLFAFIFFYERHIQHGLKGPELVLPRLDTNAVNIIQVHCAKAEPIRADRTNHTWTLHWERAGNEPVAYPADAAAVQTLLSALAQMTPAGYLTETEIRAHPNADEEFGIATPQASIIVTQSNYRAHLLVGSKTAPGDQVYLRVVAQEGLFLVDAGLLQLLPRSADDWRDRDLVQAAAHGFDRVAVTNNGRSLVVGHESTNTMWRMIWPLFQARADGARINEGLDQLDGLRIQQFVSDDAKPDLDAYGLQSPDLELSLAHGTNVPVLLQFGKSPTNHADQVYARRFGLLGVVTVEKKPLQIWRVASANDFRDPHLLELHAPVERIEVRGQDAFMLAADTNGSWRVLPFNFPADDQLVDGFVTALTNINIVQFAKDVVTPLNWPEFGLASPARQYVLQTQATNHGGLLTNQVLADLTFGFATNQPDKVFVRRADEASVYAITTNDFVQLPTASWQMRERRFWQFSIDEVAGLTISQGDKKRELARRGDHEWSLTAGSQGIIEEAAIEESVHNLLTTPALAWIAVGETNRTRFGFTSDARKLTFRLKDGQRRAIEFGGESPAGAQYAAVTLDNELWIMELPFGLYRYVLAYLSLPPGL